jgi:hypothetical protein
MRRGVIVLICAVLILLGTVVSILAGPGKAVGTIATATNPIRYPVPIYVDISGIFVGH